MIERADWTSLLLEHSALFHFSPSERESSLSRGSPSYCLGLHDVGDRSVAGLEGLVIGNTRLTLSRLSG